MKDKDYTLDTLSAWVDEALSSGYSSNQVYDTIIKSVKKNMKYHKACYDDSVRLLALLRGNTNTDIKVHSNLNEEWKNFEFPSESDYWDGKLASGMGIEAIASSFLASDEAQLQQGYSDQYGRTGTVHTYTDSSGDVHVDETKGLGYWLSDNSEKATGVSDLENFLKVTSYKGEDQDNDGKISFEEALTSKYNVSAETLVTDAKQDILGQVSNKANKAKPLISLSFVGLIG